MRYLIHASGEFEAEIIRDRLAEAGIAAVYKGMEVRQLGTFAQGGGIYVDDREVERARQVLKDAGHVTEEQLEDLSEESPPPPD